MEKSNIQNTLDNSNRYYIDLWELCDEPKNLSFQERMTSMAFLRFLKIDIEEDGLIIINARPIDLENMLIKFFRHG